MFEVRGVWLVRGGGGGVALAEEFVEGVRGKKAFGGERGKE